MRILLDTHALIWFVDQDHLLSPAAHAAISESNNDLLVSAATLWEIAIKVALKKLTLSLPYKQWIHSALTDLTATILPITVDCADVVTTLPFHHRDPFDRFIAAQSIVEQVPVVSGDSAFDSYGIQRLW